MSIAKINSEGQIKIPPEFLEALNLNPGDEIDLQIDASGRVLIQRVDSSKAAIPPKLIELQAKLGRGEKLTVDDLYGALNRQGIKTLSIGEMDEAVKAYVAESDRRTLQQNRENV
jgi:bifunctional DNA-binding transcriptional regulator/antitoxin component of YhaV-PrlF toxin-antitoxin module